MKATGTVRSIMVNGKPLVGISDLNAAFEASRELSSHQIEMSLVDMLAVFTQKAINDFNKWVEIKARYEGHACHNRMALKTNCMGRIC